MYVSAFLQSLASVPRGRVCQTPGSLGSHSATDSPAFSAAVHLQPDPPPPVLQDPGSQAQHRGW